MNQIRDRAEWLPVTDGTVPMSDEARGHAIKRRRLQLGINSLRDFADQTGVARQTISRAEDGDTRTTETTYARLEMFLERLEAQQSVSDGTTPALVSSQPEPAGVVESGTGQISFRASGVSSEAFSIDELIVDSTAEHADEARRQFVELIQEIRRTQAGATDTERP